MLKQWIRNTVINAFIFKVIVPQRRVNRILFLAHTWSKITKSLQKEMWSTFSVISISIFLFKGDTFYRNVASFV